MASFLRKVAKAKSLFSKRHQHANELSHDEQDDNSITSLNNPENQDDRELGHGKGQGDKDDGEDREKEKGGKGKEIVEDYETTMIDIPYPGDRMSHRNANYNNYTAKGGIGKGSQSSSLAALAIGSSSPSPTKPSASSLPQSQPQSQSPPRIATQADVDRINLLVMELQDQLQTEREENDVLRDKIVELHEINENLAKRCKEQSRVKKEILEAFKKTEDELDAKLQELDELDEKCRKLQDELLVKETLESELRALPNQHLLDKEKLPKADRKDIVGDHSRDSIDDHNGIDAQSTKVVDSTLLSSVASSDDASIIVSNNTSKDDDVKSSLLTAEIEGLKDSIHQLNQQIQLEKETSMKNKMDSDRMLQEKEVMMTSLQQQLQSNAEEKENLVKLLQGMEEEKNQVMERLLLNDDSQRANQLEERLEMQIGLVHGLELTNRNLEVQHGITIENIIKEKQALELDMTTLRIELEKHQLEFKTIDIDNQRLESQNHQLLASQTEYDEQIQQARRELDFLRTELSATQLELRQHIEKDAAKQKEELEQPAPIHATHWQTQKILELNELIIERDQALKSMEEAHKKELEEASFKQFTLRNEVNALQETISALTKKLELAETEKEDLLQSAVDRSFSESSSVSAAEVARATALAREEEIKMLVDVCHELTKELEVLRSPAPAKRSASRTGNRPVPIRTDAGFTSPPPPPPPPPEASAVPEQDMRSTDAKISAPSLNPAVVSATTPVSSKSRPSQSILPTSNLIASSPDVSQEPNSLTRTLLRGAMMTMLNRSRSELDVENELVAQSRAARSSPQQIQQQFQLRHHQQQVQRNQQQQQQWILEQQRQLEIKQQQMLEDQHLAQLLEEERQYRLELEQHQREQQQRQNQAERDRSANRGRSQSHSPSRTRRSSTGSLQPNIRSSLSSNSSAFGSLASNGHSGTGSNRGVNATSRSPGSDSSYSSVKRPSSVGQANPNSRSSYTTPQHNPQASNSISSSSSQRRPSTSKSVGSNGPTTSVPSSQLTRKALLNMIK